MRVVVSEERRTRQSTLVKYLPLIGPVPDGSTSPTSVGRIWLGSWAVGRN
jgi:hypothetical protein